MYSDVRKPKGKKGSVQFKNTKGRLQIVFSYPVEVDGKVRSKRFYISTGFDDTLVNRQRVGDIVRMVQRDLDYGEVDLTLERYKPRATLITISPIPPISPNELEDPEITLD